MLNFIALWLGTIVLCTAIAIGAMFIIGSMWWWAVGKIVDHVWSLKLFYQVSARILDERREADKNQLAQWPPKKKGKEYFGD